jgi:hypothetical protein
LGLIDCDILNVLKLWEKRKGIAVAIQKKSAMCGGLRVW